jgi:fluoride exporter
MQNFKWTAIAWVALGGSLGATSRFLLGVFLQHVFPAYPWGTLSVNLLGSFCAGLLLGYTLFMASPTSAFSLFAMTGFLGSFTTFSAFGYEVYTLWWSSRRAMALIHIFANLGGSLLAVGLGLACAGFFLRLLR